jgi:hypothetical protein
VQPTAYILFYLFFETDVKDLPYLLIKKKRIPSLLMKNRVKTIIKPLSGAHKKPRPNHSKEGLVETAHRRHRHHFSPKKQQLQPTNSEQTTLTSPNTIVEPTNSEEAAQSHMKIHAKAQPPATRQRSNKTAQLRL